MILDRENGLVNVWLSLIKNPNMSYSYDDVPDIYNLREIVKELLEEEGGNN